MDYIQVQSSGPLHGAVSIQGSKNSSLALLAASCLADATVTLEGIPDIYDFRVIRQIGKDIGLQIDRLPTGEMQLDPRYIHSAVIDPGKASAYRASYYFVGALLAKFGKVTVGFPGGDDFVSRPIDQHIKALRLLGAEVTFFNDYYIVEAKQLRGADIYFDMITSGATINAMLAAVRAEGRTRLYNAAMDPEVVDTANFLNQLGAKIVGAGTDHIRIEGVPFLGGGTYTVIPDRLIAGAFLMAAGIKGGSITVNNVIPEHMGSCMAKLREIGMELEMADQSITAHSTGKLRATRVRTGMYPGFATDLQQPFTALLLQAQGKSIVTERVYPKRFNHIHQLKRLGADVEVRKESAFIRGGTPLKGNWVHATDVRAGTCLLLAGLAAEGVTRITGIEHIERGYENAIHLFRSLGANVSLRSQNEEAGNISQFQ
ncbi:UDP-N-acetylglucosamine 1-carboxyvinyltransferase [Paenibacillus radicis (ex Xue et al. 2023)]|uniref:UDP-N-acetylglucosamine 1-carboxyvinyltransferase n=1 Tax=Paenibacillus radicis (ex Xue et al. 2023) TaxID=2972489 RepID=A0ABT1YLT9_9BACL|nr:UDP-N-acetylglucosamine 1-carboxyvinyltransferase [Paenibacillus radicis (ex Xue et al. 2023)]MCR8633987.1 UDP-N-acetylglucosamine 1-carboxyvinyltransferase [Paenibacillus radicis (ex Xue et al. 2023)]